jgi:hypothetical protein
MFSMHNKIVFQSFIQVYIFFLSKHVSLCYDCKFTIVLIILHDYKRNKYVHLSNQQVYFKLQS